MGIGGGAILIPALIMLEGISQQTAQGINLTYFIPTAIISLIVHIKNKNVEFKTAAVIGGFGMVGSVGGSLIAAAMSGDFLRRLFGGFLLVVGIYEIVKGARMQN